jgi:hypothetical protein
MKQRGRKSLASLAVADASVHLVERPAPPEILTAQQRAYWVEISNALPAEWFRDDNKQLLAEYCKTLVSLDFLTHQINYQESMHPEAVDADAYFDLLKRRESLARLSLTQATKMRLTQQSRYRGETASTMTSKPIAKGSPWRFGD